MHERHKGALRFISIIKLHLPPSPETLFTPLIIRFFPPSPFPFLLLRRVFVFFSAPSFHVALFVLTSLLRQFSNFPALDLSFHFLERWPCVFSLNNNRKTGWMRNICGTVADKDRPSARVAEQLWELLLIAATVTCSRTDLAICSEQIAAFPFQVQNT